MGRHSNKPLTTAEAKAALQQSAEQMSPRGYLREHPASSIALAFCGGLLMGNKKSRRFITRLVETYLITYLSRPPADEKID